MAVHPAVSLACGLLGARLFGLPGALMGVPVAATIMAMLEIYQRRYELTPETVARWLGSWRPARRTPDAHYSRVTAGW